jgi:hypothetical protein
MEFEVAPSSSSSLLLLDPSQQTQQPSRASIRNRRTTRSSTINGKRSTEQFTASRVKTFVKDLSVVESDLSKVFLVDNSLVSFELQPGKLELN